MLVEGLPDHGTDHADVDYAAIAEGVGLPSVRITDPKKLRAQLKSALKQPGPMLIDVVTNSDALSEPPKLTPQQLRGFAPATPTPVLGAAGDTMVDMAASLLRTLPD